MAHSAKVLLDSISDRDHRLTTFEVVLPRIVLAELNTHRMFGRSSASSRAVPTKKTIDRVMNDPFIPLTWGKNQRGMTAVEEILGEDALECESNWLHARDNAVKSAEHLMSIGVHKQIANRLLEPFSWHTVIISATEYSNFFALRDNKAADPNFQAAAALMHEEYKSHVPTLLQIGQWHAPYAQGNDELSSQLREITAGRCARVSYLNHDGQSSPADDIRLHDTLLENRHMAPLEHAARPMNELEYNYLFKQMKLVWDEKHQQFFQATNEKGEYLYTHFCGNFNGWVQYRKEIPYEDDYGAYKRAHGLK